MLIGEINRYRGLVNYMRNYTVSVCCIFLLSMTLFIGGCSDEQSKKIQLSAEQGDTDAQYLLGRMYTEGQGVRKDKDQAIYWYKKAIEGYLDAAEQGNIDAQFELAMMLTKGYGVSKDEIKSFHWFQKAAEQGHVDAQYNLGKMYAQGRGVDKDKNKAVEWYKKAAKHGNADAQSELRVIADENKTQMSYYDDGQLRSETPYKDGNVNGTVMYYNQHSGNVIQAVKYVDGIKHGTTIVYNADRTVFAEIYYEHGSAKSGVCYGKEKFDNESFLVRPEKIVLTNAQLQNWENGHSLVCR